MHLDQKTHLQDLLSGVTHFLFANPLTTPRTQTHSDNDQVFLLCKSQKEGALIWKAIVDWVEGEPNQKGLSVGVFGLDKEIGTIKLGLHVPDDGGADHVSITSIIIDSFSSKAAYTEMMATRRVLLSVAYQVGQELRNVSDLPMKSIVLDSLSFYWGLERFSEFDQTFEFIQGEHKIEYHPLDLLNIPGLVARPFYEKMSSWKKGGLHPSMLEKFMAVVESLPPVENRFNLDLSIFEEFNLDFINSRDWANIHKEVIRIATLKSKRCWHPNTPQECSLDANGEVKITAAHSIQKSGPLKRISEELEVSSYGFSAVTGDGERIRINSASVFWGFCNAHDGIFKPIEDFPFDGTPKQNFLFAYRAFVVTAHQKVVESFWLDTGTEWKNDQIQNKKIFDKAILDEDWSVIQTEVIDLPGFFPLVFSSSFYLDFDFEGNAIPHSDQRMEKIFVTLLPNDDKTTFLISCLSQDGKVYHGLIEQLKSRKNLLLDISILIAPHVENIFFSPSYYTKYIASQEKNIKLAMKEAQFDFAPFLSDGTIGAKYSLTPHDYLSNPLKINFFHLDEPE